VHTEKPCIREAKALPTHMQEAQLYAYIQVLHEEGMSLCIQHDCHYAILITKPTRCTHFSNLLLE